MTTAADVTAAVELVIEDWLRKYQYNDPAEFNGGDCEAFAEAVVDLLGDDRADLHTLWLEDEYFEAFQADVGHKVVWFNGRLYDSECPQGVDRWQDIPLCQSVLFCQKELAKS